MPLRIAIGASLVCFAATGCKRSQAAGDERPAIPTASQSVERKLTVLIVVDQLASWTFERDLPFMRGGLKRLVNQGTFYSHAEFPYANTSTAPGHAALGTGAPPAVTGIMANSWYGRDGALHPAVDDEAHPMLHVAPALSRGQRSEKMPNSGVSSKNLRVEGLADALRKQRRGARSVAVGLKTRATALMLGQRPDIAVFYDDDQGAMTTSTFFASELPSWLVSFGKEFPVSRYRDYVWTLKDPKAARDATGIPDASPGEGEDFYGLDNQFPHPLTESPHKALRATPAGTDLVFDAAEAAVLGVGLGKDQVPDLLGITLSSHDYAGHIWGQESWERFDVLLRLDERLGEFLDFLDREVGVGAYAVVLTSDHGATPMVELSQRAGKKAHRLTDKVIVKAANEAARTVLGGTDWVKGYTANSVYFSPAFARQPKEKRQAALAAALTAIKKLPGAGYAALTETIIGNCDKRKGEEALACRAVDAERSGPIFVSAARYSVAAPHFYKTGTSHGSPNTEDRQVPIVVFGRSVKQQRSAEAVSALAVASTVSDLLGIRPPAEAKTPSLLAPPTTR